MNTRLHRPNPVYVLTRAVCVGLTSMLLCTMGMAQADKSAERNARRAQLQLQNLQQQLDAALVAKTQSEVAKADAEKRQQADAQVIARLRASLRQAEAARKALLAEKGELSARVAALQTEVIATKRAGEEMIATNDRNFATQIKTHETTQRQLQTRFDQELATLADCGNKNERLLAIGAELLDRYRKKNFAAVLAQRDPVLGLGDVQMFNLVQDYRDRTDAERFRAASVR